MSTPAAAALLSWNLDLRVIALLALIAAVYIRGWLRRRSLVLEYHATERLASFLLGLLILFIAGESPLDAFDNFYLSAHMVQHLLLMMIAPPLILLGHPLIPLLTGLPKNWVKEGLGPFLTWRPLKRFFGWLTSPPIAWLAFAVSTIAWHLPRFYELALSSPRWHNFQHASFFWTGILFWWPIIRPGPGKSKWPAWLPIPYLLFADIVNTALSAFLIFSGRLLYPSYEALHAGGINPQDDQVLAGAIMWVPGSIVYIVPAIVVAMRLFSRPHVQPRAIHRRTAPTSRSPLLLRLPVIPLRRAAQIVMLLIALAVMADGFFGPQVAPENLAGVLPWIHWRALSLAALLLIGNLFCMACPFTLVRDIGRRLMFPAKLHWPRALRGKWLPIALILTYLWTYEAFSLWNSPWITAWIIAGYFLAALIIDGIFRGASFCKYVCPIGQFHFVTSLISPREIGVRDHKICDTCKTHDCIHGNQRARGCELSLFQPTKSGNMDCTFCLDCVNACPHENVSLVRITPATTLSSGSKRWDIAVLALLIVFAAFVNAAAMLETPINRHVSAFILGGTVLIPAVAVGLCSLLNRLSDGNTDTLRVARRFIFALVPIGIAMWAAHLLFHLVTSGSAAIPAIQRAATGVIHIGAVAFTPAWLTPLQLLLLDSGLLLSIYIVWRVGKQILACTRSALILSAPWAGLACVLYAVGVWILFQPMQMRGMLH